MTELLIFLKLCLLAYAVYSGITYMVRRSGNKSAFTQLRQAPVLRQLSAEEKQALTPFLDGKEVGSEVRALSGNFVRHGLETQGSTTMHDTLGGVDVVLPYDAMVFLDAHNQAEVVLAAKHAVVVKLNGFDLLEGRERSQQAQQAQADWEQAKPGSLLQSVGSEEPAQAMAPAQTAVSESHAVEIISQRLESAEEIAERTFGLPGWGTAFVWLLALIALWVGSWELEESFQIAALALAGLAVLWALWLTLRRKPASQEPAQTVNKVRGVLNGIQWVNPDNASVTMQKFFIGDQVAVNFPAHWQQTAQGLPVGRLVEADVRVKDNAVVGFGRGWSLAEEWRRFPPVWWGRYLLLCMAGLLGLLVLCLSGSPLGASAARVAHGLLQPAGSSHTDPAALRAQPPRWASEVQLHGQGRCEMRMPPLGQGLPERDCSVLRWGGTAPQLPDLELPEAVAQVGEADFFQPRDSMGSAAVRMLQNLALMRMMGGDRSLNAAALMAGRQMEVPQQWDDMGRKLSQLDAACEAEGGLAARDCQKIRTKLMAVANDGAEEAEVVHDWETFQRLAQPGEAHASLVMTEREQSELRTALTTALDHAVSERAKAAMGRIKAAQGGVLLVLPSAEELQPYASKNDERLSQLERWKVLQTNASDSGLRRFTLTGMVTAVGQGDGGALRLALDPGLADASLPQALAKLCLALLVTALLLVGGSLLGLRLRASGQRKQALQADLDKRPAPGGQGFA
ncbi:MAG: intracellular growth attenuator family protein [Acidovorax sp.]|jgi:hypothetical protein|nr:intracellular growth attenuator family protein [Acidovorax sp.]